MSKLQEYLENYNSSGAGRYRLYRRLVIIFIALLFLALACIIILVRNSEVQLRFIGQQSTILQIVNQLDLSVKGAVSAKPLLPEQKLLAYRRVDVAANHLLKQISDLWDKLKLDQQLYFNSIIKDFSAYSSLLKQGGSVELLQSRLNNINLSLEKFLKTQTAHLYLAEQSLYMKNLWLRLLLIGLFLLSAVIVVIIFMALYRDMKILQEYKSLLQSENTLLSDYGGRKNLALQDAKKQAEKERIRAELLLQDASHRIGNSLATVSSLLGVQLRKITDITAKEAIIAAQNRIQIISNTHRRLRLGLSDDLVDTKGFLELLINDLKATSFHSDQKNIKLISDISSYYWPSRDITSIGIILGELLSNAGKHAFANKRSGCVKIFLGELNERIVLMVEDNGAGINLPELEERHAGKKGAKSNNSEGIGRLLIEQLCLQLGEAPIYENLAAMGSQGTRVTIVLSKLSKDGHDVALAKQQEDNISNKDENNDLLRPRKMANNRP